MADRLGEVLYWFFTSLALVCAAIMAIGLVFNWRMATDAVVAILVPNVMLMVLGGVLPAALVFVTLVVVFLYLLGRACRYVLAGRF